MNKWRHVRDNFTRSLKKPKSGGGANKGRKYIFSQQLSFLISSDTPASTESSLDPNETDAEQQSQISEGEDGEPQEKRRKTAYTRREQIEQSLLDYLSAPSLEPTETNSTQLFLNSLVPMVERFTEDNQLHFRCEVLNLITRIRAQERETQQLNYNQSQTQGYHGPWNTHHHSYPLVSRDPRISGATSFPHTALSPQTAPVDRQRPYHAVAEHRSFSTGSPNLQSARTFDFGSRTTAPRGSGQVDLGRQNNPTIHDSLNLSNSEDEEQYIQLL